MMATALYPFQKVINDLIEHNNILLTPVVRDKKIDAEAVEYRKKAKYLSLNRSKIRNYQRLKFCPSGIAYYKGTHFFIDKDFTLYVNNNKIKKCLSRKIATLEADIYIVSRPYDF